MKYSTSSLIHQLNVEMNRAADRLLQAQVDLSYSRFNCLFHILELDSASQHTLAVAMGYSDPAISKMVNELCEDGLVKINLDPRHKRRKIVRLSTRGKKTADKCLELLDECFTDVVNQAGINETKYAEHTFALLQAMKHKNKEY